MTEIIYVAVETIEKGVSLPMRILMLLRGLLDRAEAFVYWLKYLEFEYEEYDHQTLDDLPRYAKQKTPKRAHKKQIMESLYLLWCSISMIIITIPLFYVSAVWQPEIVKFLLLSCLAAVLAAIFAIAEIRCAWEIFLHSREYAKFVLWRNHKSI